MASGKIVFPCRGCNRVLSVDEKLKGRKIRCSQCKRISLIPATSTAELPDDPAPQATGDATTVQQTSAEPSPNGGETVPAETKKPPSSDADMPPPAPPASPSSSGPTTTRAKKIILKKPAAAKPAAPEPDKQPDEPEPEATQPPSEPDSSSTESEDQAASEPAPADDASPDEPSPPAATPSTGPATVRAKKIILKKPAAKPTDPEPEKQPDEPEPEASEPPSEPDTPSTESEAQPAPEPPRREPPAASDGDTEDWRTRAQEAEGQLTALTAQREKEEVAYSRTITKLTTQLEEANHLREQLEAEAAELRQQQQHWESNAEQQVEAAANVLAAAREAVDVFCNDQLGAMQSLRQSLKELTGEES